MADRVPIPTAVEVGPFTYTVATDELAVLRMNTAEATKLFGKFDERTLTITVDLDGAVGQIRDTFLHELLHGVFALTGQGEQLTGDLEERIIRSLAPALLDVLRRNPNLVAFLTAA